MGVDWKSNKGYAKDKPIILIINKPCFLLKR